MTDESVDLQPRFEYVSLTSARMRCTICGHSGYPGGTWMDRCRGSHADACACGRRYPDRAGLASHIMMRARFGDTAHARQEPTCTVPHCGRPAYGGGQCVLHVQDYLDWRRETAEAAT